MKKPKKQKCRRRKPRVKIVKEKEFTLHRCHRCMTRKCPLCGKKVDSTKLLNLHVMEEHDNYQFLCKFHKFRRSYSSSKSVRRHVDIICPPDLCVIPVENSYMRSMSLRLIKMFTLRNVIHVIIQNVTVCTSQQPNMKGI